MCSLSLNSLARFFLKLNITNICILDVLLILLKITVIYDVKVQLFTVKLNTLRFACSYLFCSLLRLKLEQFHILPLKIIQTKQTLEQLNKISA